MRQILSKLLDEEDTQRSNLNSKYVCLTLVLNILILLFVFTVFDTCKIRLILRYEARVKALGASSFNK